MMNDPAVLDHCRDVIQACLNVVDQQGDAYVAIHKENGVECVVVVSMLRTRPILSIIIADKILFAAQHSTKLLSAANNLNSDSLIGWHSIQTSDDVPIYMYRQCIWMTMALDADTLMDMIQDCISEYMHGRDYLISQDEGPDPCA